MFNYAKFQLEQVINDIYLFILLIFPPRFPGGNDEMAIIVLIIQKRIVSNSLIIYHSKYILIYKFHFSSCHRVFSQVQKAKTKKLVIFQMEQILKMRRQIYSQIQYKKTQQWRLYYGNVSIYRLYYIENTLYYIVYII